MSLKNWLRSQFALCSSRSKKQAKPLPPRRNRPWLEVLEDRLVPDSGGAAGVLTAAGNVQLNPTHLNTIGFTQVIPNVKIQLIFLTDPNNGSPLSVPAATQTALTNFFTTITSDQYIPSLVSPYGGIMGLPAIGTGSVGVVDTLASVNADTTLAGHRAYSSGNLTSIIQTEINNGNTAASDGLNNLYFVFTPPADAVIQGNINSIQNFGGYHSSFVSGGKRVYYAIIPDETSVNMNVFGAGATNALRGETVVSSHEMAEAITDDVGPRGWVNPTLLGNGEIGDLAVDEVYVQDGHEVQYEWSNAIVGAAHAPGNGKADLFINQVTPPAVPVGTSTSVPVASFTTANTSLTAGSFSAIVLSYDTTGHGTINWTVTSITGGNGHFVVNARPNTAVTVGTYGTTFAQEQGLYVDILDNNSADATAVDGGIPIAQTYAPFVVAAASPLTYITDAGTHNLVLKKNGANYELRDNGNLVFTQPAALTTSIVINGDGDPAGVDNSLTLDFSGGVFNTLPVIFDGGNGSGSHKLTVTGALLTSLTYDATAANAGDFVVNGNAANKITCTHVQTVTDSATTGTVALNVDPNNAMPGIVNTTFTGSGANSSATLGNGLPGFTFGNPTAALVVAGHAANDNITFTSLGSGFNAALTVTGNGGTDTVNLNTALGLGSGTSSGNMSITASTIHLNAATITTDNGGANGAVAFNGAVTLQQGLSVTTGSGAATFNGTVDGGFALQVNSSGATTFAGVVGTMPLAALAVSGPVILAGGSITVSGLVGFGDNATLTTNIAISYAGANALQISGSTLSLGSNQLTLTDTASTDTGSISSQITGTGSLIKDGPGTLTLTNAGNSYSGGTIVNAGTLLVDGATASDSTVTVADGATLGGSGTINGAVSDSGVIAPGDGLGILNTGSVTFADNATFAVQIGGAAAGDGGNHYDQLNVSGTVALGSAVTLNLSALNGFVPVGGQSFTIINNAGAGALSGIFSGLDEGATLSNFLGTGLNAVITYAGGPNGNDVILTVQAATQTTLTSSANPATFGQSVTFTATVTSAAGTPSGTVTFVDGATTMGTGTLDGNGIATFSTSSLSVAPHSVTAVYGDDGYFLGSISPAVSQVVGEAGTNTSLTSSANPSTFGQSVIFTATVTSAVGAPSGTVTFVDGATTLGTGTLDGNGIATFSTSSLAADSHAITAVYGDNGNLLASTSPILTQGINKASTKTALTSSANPSQFGKSVTFTATVISAAATPTGTVTFYNGSILLGTGTLNNSGIATFSTSSLTIAAHSIIAVYAANGNFLGSVSPLLPQVVAKASTSTKLTALANPTAPGQSMTFTAVVTAAVGSPTGAVTFTDGTKVIGTAILSNGKATLTVSNLPQGNHSIAAVYGGDIDFLSSMATLAVTI